MMNTIRNILLIILIPKIISAQQEVHRGGAGDGYASVTYYKTSAIQKNTTSPLFELKDNQIYNLSATSPCSIAVIDVLGKQLFNQTIPPLSSILLPEFVSTISLLKIKIGEENHVRLMQP